MDTLARLLTITFTANDTESIARASAEIEHLKQSSTNFYSALIDLIRNDYQSILAKSASTYLRNAVRDAVENKTLEELELAEISESIFSLLTGPISKEIRSILCFSLSPIVAGTHSINIIDRLLQLSLLGLKSDPNHVKGSLVTLRVIFSCTSKKIKIGDSVEFILTALEEIGIVAWESFVTTVIGQEETIAFEVLSLIDDWTYTVKTIIEFLEISGGNGLKLLIKHSLLSEIFTGILLFEIPQLEIPSGTGLFSISFEPFNNTLNCIKSIILNSLNIIFDYLVSSKKRLLEEQGVYKKVMSVIGVDLPESPFLTTVQNVLERLIEHTIELSQLTDLQRYLADSALNNCLIESLIFFEKTAGEARYFPLFGVYGLSLILEVSLNILECSESDMVLFMENPSEFVNNTMDICEKHESETLKASVAKLVEAVCDNIDGILPSLIEFLVEMVQHTVRQKPVEEYFELNKLNCMFLNKPGEIKVETAFLLFSVLSYTIVKRPDLLKQIEELLIELEEPLQNSSSFLIKSRLCLLMYFYCEYIFVDEEERFFDWVFFLARCMEVEVNPSALIIQACESFAFLAQDEDIVFRLKEMVHPLVDLLISFIPSQKEKNFFEGLADILMNFSELFKEKFEVIIETIVNKIEKEVETQKNEIIVEKCWNIIKLFSESPVVTNEIESFEILISPLYSLLQKIEFEDDILVIILTIIKRLNRVTEIQWKIFQFLPSIQEKQRGALINVFKVLNYFIGFGKDYISNNISVVGLIIEMANTALFSETIKESSSTQGALLLQLLLQHLPSQIDAYLETILITVLLRYEKPRTQTFFTNRLLGVIYCGFIYNCELTFEILEKHSFPNGISYLNYILVQILQNAYLISHSYDRRVSVLGLSEVLMFSTPPTVVINILPQIFETLIIILSNTSNLQPEKSIKTEMEKVVEQILEGVSDDELFDEQIIVRGTQMFAERSQEWFSHNEEAEASVSLHSIISPMMQIDEYETFRGHMNNLNAVSQEAVRNLVEPLTRERKEQLVDILKSERVKINGLAGDNTVVRKIVRSRNRNEMNL